MPAKSAAPMAPAFTQHHTLSSRRCAHRRRVDGSGKRDGSLQCGAACSTESPAAMPLTGLLPAAQAEMPRRRQPIGQDREGLPARLTDSAPHPDAFVLVIVGLAEPPSVADDRVVAGKPDIAAAGGPAGSPRIDVVFRLWQCDKENHGWREGPPLTVACQVSICWPGLHPPGKVSFERKKNTAFRRSAASPHSEHWPV